MTLDIPTLMLVLLLGYALLALELSLTQRRLVAQEALRRWAWSAWLLVLGYLLLAARMIVPERLSVIGGNAMVLLGVVLMADAMSRFVTERPLPRWLWWGYGLSLPAWYGFALLPTPQRVALASLLLALPPLWMLLLIWRYRRGLEPAMRIVAVTLVLMVLALAVRGVDALRQPSLYENPLRDGGMQGLVMLASFLTMLGTGFGFVLACSERATRRMEMLASHDDLTGALNRKAAELVLAHGLERARRDAVPLAFVLVDLDQFKRINDEHGHAMGDEVLRCFVATVRARLRASDVVARYGGEEFALILPGSDAAGALRLAEDLRAAVAALRLALPEGTAVPPLAFTMSAGVAVAERGEVAPAQLYRGADRALYRAKHEGRDRVLAASAVDLA
jgi:diguanylate cyclase (GGDEF)-like protein